LYAFALIELNCKLTMPNCNPIPKVPPLESNLKHTPSKYNNLGSILDIPIMSTFKIHNFPQFAFKKYILRKFRIPLSICQQDSRKIKKIY